MEDSVFQAEYEKQQRKAYERALQQNQRLVHKVKQQAESEADQSYQRLSSSARKKVDLE